ncbi:MAG: hypothetical protein ACJARD_000276 [Alphaproteobacteria bacterium]|jgi:hypothetical protein
MGYSSDLSDNDWAIIEPLLSSLLDYWGYRFLRIAHQQISQMIKA